MEHLRLSQSVTGFAKKNVVMMVALLAAVVTAFFVPPDKAYLGYFDVKTLTCLFCVLAVVCALKNIRFFYMLAKKIVRLFKNAFSCVIQSKIFAFSCFLCYFNINLNGE